ncbi:UNVERIFIED_CONTAM: putative protein phosphatase 2C 55 [Sesamum calycinum]|uniref:Protein phosphatase n=1 Tax=Sesamum calycinum TaxID=2727403 RepID=A0AAW2RUD5_9LAMI
MMQHLRRSLSKAFGEPRSDLTILAGSFYIPKDKPSKPRGEDAHFYSEEAQVIGVADGVGGCSSRGIDAGEYARELMSNAAKAVHGRHPADVDPKDVLKDAFLKTGAPGSSTACIISIAGGRLRAANLGDSGFLVIRGGKTVYKSPAQLHGFNYPYQMGSTSVSLPDEAEEMVMAVERGDIVIAGTDGLFDNLFPEDIEETVKLYLKKESLPEVVAFALARAARKKSMEKTTASPFAVAAYEAGVEHFGGKYDDITVVAAYVVVPDSLYLT